MFFTLSKLIRIFLDPVFVLFLFALIIFLFCGKRFSKKIKCIITLGFIIIYISFSQIFSGYMLLKLENSVPSADITGKYDYIVVPSGFVDITQPFDDIPEFSGGIERLLYAVKFLKEKHAPVIIFTGGSGLIKRTYPGEAVINADFAKKYFNVKSNQILIENESANSRENALFTASLIQNKPNAKILLVTSAFHMLRMSLSLKKVGLKFDTYSVDYKIGKTFHNAPLNYFFPSVQGVQNLRIVINEYVGLIAYKFMGYV